MLRIIVLAGFFLGLSAATFAQTPAYPKGYFRWPLNLNPEIVANLGELRSNHWHMGLDIRTAQKVNQLVYAAADGYIASIGIRPLSFGRFIVINHPNGLSTLYAHLNDFAPELEAYVTRQQYERESWAVELNFTPDQFPVKKGSFIAYSGTTGGSQGPHVHFEIRDTRSGKCLNPLLFGMPLQDRVPPSIIKLALYDRTVGVYESKPRMFSTKAVTGGLTLAGNELVRTGSKRVSLAIQTYDRISGSANQDGVYRAALYLDNEPRIDFVIDSIGYDETRYMNAHIDYKLEAGGGPYLQHLSRLPGDRSSVYHPAAADGILLLNDTLVHAVRVDVDDAYGNRTTLRFNLQYDPSLMVAFRPPVVTTDPQTISGELFIPNYVNVLERSDFELYMPETAIYDTIVPVYYRSTAFGTNAVSAMHQVNDPSLPIHTPIRVRIKPDSNIPSAWRDKLLIVRSYQSSRTVRKAEWQGEWLAAEFTDFGYYRAYVDLEPPTILPPGRGDTVLLTGSQIAFTPTDNFGIKNFRAELDGSWLRFTNDKGRTWIYRFDERCPYGVHQLKVTVEDLAGNVTEKVWWFKREAYKAPVKKASSKKAPAKKTPVRKKTTTKKK